MAAPKKKKTESVDPRALKNRMFRLSQVTLNQLQEWADEMSKTQGGKKTRSDALRMLAQHGPSKPVMTPHYGEVPCGPPAMLPDTPPMMVDLSAGWRGANIYALTARGDSMIDHHICPGDQLVIRRQDTAQNGQVVVAIADGEVTVKTYCVRKNPDTGKTEHLLLPANSAHKVIRLLPDGDNRIIGLLVGVIRKC